MKTIRSKEKILAFDGLAFNPADASMLVPGESGLQGIDTVRVWRLRRRSLHGDPRGYR